VEVCSFSFCTVCLWNVTCDGVRAYSVSENWEKYLELIVCGTKTEELGAHIFLVLLY
jgi:hypothetical protein